MHYAVGDRVVLKSGGPEMTVHKDQGSGIYYCVWFNKDGAKYSLEGTTFKADTLKKVG